MKIIKYLLIILLTFNINVYADINIEFENWKKNFKKIALKNNISEKTFDKVMSNTKFLSMLLNTIVFNQNFMKIQKLIFQKEPQKKKFLKVCLFINKIQI